MHVYPEPAAAHEIFWRLEEGSGLSMARNTIVKLTSTELVMIMDDDVMFHGATNVEILVEHLRTSPAAVVAACYYPSDCYAYKFLKAESGQDLRLQPVAARPGTGLQWAELAHNVFVARTSVMHAVSEFRMI